MLAGMLLAASCVSVRTTATPQPNIPNPASVFCEKNGGTLELRQDAAGNVNGVCHFPDGSQCDEWAYFHGECKPGDSLAAPQPPASPTAIAPSPSPEQAASPTAVTPSPSPKPAVLRVAYFGGGKIMLWDEGAAPRPLVDASNVEQVRISDDGAVVAYMGRNLAGAYEIYAVKADGSNPHLVVGQDYLHTFLSADSTLTFDFVPASHTLYFATDQYDLHRVDVDNATPERVFQASKGGYFSISPDGHWMTLYHPNQLLLVPLPASAASARVVLQFPDDFSSTLGPDVVWKSDSAGFYLAAAMLSPRSDVNQAVWFVPTSGDPVMQMSYIGPYGANLSPDGRTVVYLNHQNQPVDVHIVTTDGKDTAYNSYPNVGFMGWAPDGQHFLLDLSTDQRFSVPYLCAAGAQPVKLNRADDAQAIVWVDAQRLLFVSHGLSLHLQTVGQPDTVVDNNASSWFDFTHIHP